MRWTAWLTRAVLVGCLGSVPAAMLADPLPVSNLVVFGDSLSDNGNAAIGSNGLFPGPNYAPGEFTNGANTTPATTGPFGLWSEQFAQKLGVPQPLPYLSGAPGASTYAVASAQTGSNSIFWVSDQVNIYLAQSLGSASSSSLYTFWAGANDVGNGANAKTAADNIAQNISTLAAAGGKNFLWLNLPPLGNTPLAFGLNQQVPGTSAALNAASAQFNAEWQTDLYTLNAAGIDVIGVDVNSLFQQIAANYAAGCTVGAANPYCFANITSPAQGVTGADPNTYLFWDDQHPTTQTDSLVADAALADVDAVPEPASVTMGAAGLSWLMLWTLRRRSNQKSKV